MSRHVNDIRRGLSGRADRMAREARGAVDLSYMRGFQAGYEQAYKDAKVGRLDKINALLPHRAEPKGKR